MELWTADFWRQTFEIGIKNHQKLVHSFGIGYYSYKLIQIQRVDMTRNVRYYWDLQCWRPRKSDPNLF